MSFIAIFTIAGEYSGVAPGARLCVLDLGVGDQVCVPTAKQMVSGPHAAGARVFSNSFVDYFPNNAGFYSSQDIDSYLYKHQVGIPHMVVIIIPLLTTFFSKQDILVLFAAGNNGNQGQHSISTESTGKNCVSVGAGQIEANGVTTTLLSYYSSIGPTYDGRYQVILQFV